MDVEGVGIIVADAAMQLQSGPSHGETPGLRMTPADFNKYGCDLMWRASDKASGRGSPERNRHPVFDYTARRPVTVPGGFRHPHGG